MVRSNDPFWVYVKQMSDGGTKCRFCGRRFAVGTSISRIKLHLSGVKRHGVVICEEVPDDVQEAAYLASIGANKRPRTMSSCSSNNEATYATSTPPGEQNYENANLTLSRIERELMEDSSAGAGNHVDNRTTRTPQPMEESDTFEWFRIDELVTRLEAIQPTTDEVGLLVEKDWGDIYASAMEDNALLDEPNQTIATSLEGQRDEVVVPAASTAPQPSLRKLMSECESRLLVIRAMLDDAEEKQVTNQFMKTWLSKLKDLSYDVEDILDELETEASKIKLKSAESQTSTCTVQEFPTAFCADLQEKGLKLQEIAERFEEIVKQQNVLGLGTNVGGMSNRVNSRVPTTSLVKEARVYGRDQDKEHLVELLLSAEASNSRYSVIPITGLGGIGKTTLAQLAYYDERLKFDHKAWVCVSDEFDVTRITKTVLLHMGGDHEVNDLNVLQQRLKDELHGKKFLIVLDDIWQHEYDDWTSLCSPLAAAAFGSKIIVTTRCKDVASMISTTMSYELKELSYNECLCLFAQHAVDAENFAAHPNLKEVGQKIVERCKGLPLAAKALGGLLRHKQSFDEWEDVLNSEIWDLPEKKTSILSALRLSYHHLPSQLKQCFAYCAIFPKDYEFDENELVLLWMAQGFLQQKPKRKQMADLGHDYFRDLSSRCFFQQSSSDKSRYVMHDLISDLARFVSGETCFHLDDKMKDADSMASHATIRHSSFTSHNYDTSRRFDVFRELKSLRTFMGLMPAYLITRRHSLSSRVLNDVVPKLKYLRVLSLVGYSIVELPNSISALKLLRYLNLSDSQIRMLPESLGELFNLQTLRLHGCTKLVELHACIGNLINLQCLDIEDTYLLRSIPLQISRLINLRIFPKFIVGEGNGLEIKELMRLEHLRGKLLIQGLHNVVHPRDADLANLKDKRGIDDLALEWVDNFNRPREEGSEEQILNALKPHRSLEKLSIRAYGGTEFPSWIGDHSFDKMVDMKLLNCRKITSLPSLKKLPALRHLHVQGLDGVKEVSLEDFPSLETLYIEDMSGWEQWSLSDCPIERVGAGKFPKLHELTLINCPKLIGKLPSCLSSLRMLYVNKCQDVVLRVACDLTSLAKLEIGEISGLVSLHEELLKALVAVEDLTITECMELKYLWEDGIDLDKLCHLKRLKINSCEQLVSLVEGEEALLPCNLRVLKILWCPNLEKLPNGLCSLTLLRELEIYGCSGLSSFPKGAGMPCCLKSLDVMGCESLESLPDGIMITMMNGNQQCVLEELKICGCPSLKHFGRGGRLPTTLKQLSIGLERCETSFQEGIFHGDDASDMFCYSHLEDLSVSNFSLASFPAGFEFPLSLKTLVFEACERIQSLPSSLHALSHLIYLRIRGCHEFELFPEGGFRLPNLIQFRIDYCKKLRCLPNHMEYLTSLQELYIRGCHSVESFPESGFPPSLTGLNIINCEKLAQQPMSEWRLYSLTSLRHLIIDFKSGCGCSTGGGKEDVDYCFPDEDGLLLPTSLTYVSIDNQQNLKSISRGIQCLTSLEELFIINCPNLMSLPEEGFPSTLGRLKIFRCPLLQERCMEEKGDYWPIIAHIPCCYVG